MLDAFTWDTIAVPTRDFNVRQLIGTMPVPCFWGRDIKGSCLFIIELKGDHSAQYRKNLSTVNGVRVDLREDTDEQQRLVLTLENEANRDLFGGLCRTLANALTHATDSASSLSVALTHIRRWKTFFSGWDGAQLSADEVRGLFAELCFLQELLDNTSTRQTALAAWLGPERSHQDFIFGNSAVEIKSLSGVERNSVRISSEDQLESLNDGLFLRIYRLSSLEGAVGARSLNDIVVEIQASLDWELQEALDKKLAKQRYAPFPSYDAPRFVVSEIRNFHVTEKFPKLIRSELPNGILNLTYDIKFESIASFECHNDVVFEGL